MRKSLYPEIGVLHHLTPLLNPNLDARGLLVGLIGDRIEARRRWGFSQTSGLATLPAISRDDLGYFDLEQKTLQPLDNPFGTRLSPILRYDLSPMYPGRTQLFRGGESVSQPSLKDKAFSTFLDQNPQFELTGKGDFAFDKSLSRQWPVIDNSAIKRLAKGKLPSHRSA